MRNGPGCQAPSLFNLAMAIERKTGITVASLSSYSVVYKVRGSIETLYQYYPELRSPDYHGDHVGPALFHQYSYGLRRVQPFSPDWAQRRDQHHCPLASRQPC
jgi:hypothetical protein